MQTPSQIRIINKVRTGGGRVSVYLHIRPSLLWRASCANAVLCYVLRKTAHGGQVYCFQLGTRAQSAEGQLAGVGGSFCGFTSVGSP